MVFIKMEELLFNPGNKTTSEKKIFENNNYANK